MSTPGCQNFGHELSLFEQCLELSLDWDSTEDIVRGCVDHVSKEKDVEIERLKAENVRLKQLNLMTDEQIVMDQEAEINQLKGERAILVEGLNSLKWTLDLTLKRFEDRQKSE
jgi:hypothetical protein